MKNEQMKSFFKISSTRRDNTKGVPLVVNYHSGLKIIDQPINRNLHLPYLDQEINTLFSRKAMVSFHSTMKLSSSLVGAKMYL